jgi:hypothetical protein
VLPYVTSQVASQAALPAASPATSQATSRLTKICCGSQHLRAACFSDDASGSYVEAASR